MPTKSYDLRLYGRRRCKNCFWYEKDVCFFHSTPIFLYPISPDSWCPDWNSRRIEKKEGHVLADTNGYADIIRLIQQQDGK